MSFLFALQFLTVIPLPLPREPRRGEVGRSLIYFPLVGLIIGVILAGLNWLFRLFLPVAVVNGLLLAALAVISGALHLDGFADTCDGIAGNKSVEDRWRVMHDSRSGAFGIVGLALLLLIQYLALNSIPENLIVFALVLAPVLSRWSMVYAVFAYPYARPSGLGRLFKEGVTWWGFLLATLLTLAIALDLSRLPGSSYSYLAGLAIMVISWVVIMVVAAYLRRKFAGLTGDTYGAISEMVEVTVLLLVVIIAGNPVTL